jgi:quinolinate synthase
MVHDMFGQAVTERVRTSYGDAYQAAHFEVPGEMFDLALEAARRGMGTVGSTKNILDFIADRTQAALDAGFAQRLQFVLGTEAGMVTSIVNKVKGLLREARAQGNETPVEVEVVFPVSVDAITPANGSGGSEALAGLSIVPGVASGEGCSTAGGCASCPYMKVRDRKSFSRVVTEVLVGRSTFCFLLLSRRPGRRSRVEANS